MADQAIAHTTLPSPQELTQRNVNRFMHGLDKCLTPDGVTLEINEFPSVVAGVLDEINASDYWSARTKRELVCFWVEGRFIRTVIVITPKNRS